MNIQEKKNLANLATNYLEAFLIYKHPQNLSLEAGAYMKEDSPTDLT